MVTKEIEWILNIAQTEASNRQHNYLLVEHLLLAICESQTGKDFLTYCEVNINEVVDDLFTFLDQQRVASKVAGSSRSSMPMTSLMVERIVKRAVEQALLSEKQECNITDVLIAMMKEDDSYAVSLLKRANLTRLRMMNVVKHFEDNFQDSNNFLQNPEEGEVRRITLDSNHEDGFIRFSNERLSKKIGGRKDTDESTEDDGGAGLDYQKKSSTHDDISHDDISVRRLDIHDRSRESANTGRGRHRGELSDEKILQEFLIDLNEKARNKRIDPLIGREDELNQMLLVLGRRKKNNPILVGDPGVGKTAMVEGLALAITEKSVHEKFYDYQVYSLELGSILAGTKFRGDLEERINRIFAILKRKTKCIVFIDEVHVLVGAGATTGSGVDVSNLIKPLLVGGEILIIGATTFEEYRNHFQKDSALNRRFEKIEIKEPSESETVQILERLVPYYEYYHEVVYPQSLIETLPKLCKEYFLEKHLPDGAIDILDLAGSMTKLNAKKTVVKRRGVVPSVELKAVEKLIAKISGRPLKQIEDKTQFNFNSLSRDIRKQIFGQDHVVEQVLKAVKLSKLGIVEGERPIGSFLFAGPTGVGKTEFCRELSKLLALNLIRLDMSEFMEAHSVAKLIGAPPGYVGYNERKGELSEQVRKHPHSLLLLDEIEKAHPDVVNAFLQVMDYGKLTDSTGQKVSFKNTLIIMTSNLGADEMMGNTLGFNQSEEQEKIKQGKVEEPIKRFFRPEFRNRLTAVIKFNFLSKTVAEQIVNKLVRELNQQLSKKQIQIVVEQSALKHLLTQYDPQMGGRSIKRVFEQQVKERIADFIFGNTTKFFSRKPSNAEDEFTKIIFYLKEFKTGKKTKTTQNTTVTLEVKVG